MLFNHFVVLFKYLQGPKKTSQNASMLHKGYFCSWSNLGLIQGYLICLLGFSSPGLSVMYIAAPWPGPVQMAQYAG